jgi:hypothetical protein
MRTHLRVRADLRLALATEFQSHNSANPSPAYSISHLDAMRSPGVRISPKDKGTPLSSCTPRTPFTSSSWEVDAGFIQRWGYRLPLGFPCLAPVHLGPDEFPESFEPVSSRSTTRFRLAVIKGAKNQRLTAGAIVETSADGLVLGTGDADVVRGELMGVEREIHE